MDEDNYRVVRSGMVSVSCVFEKSILANRARCSKATKSNLAEREIVHCQSEKCQLRCGNWLKLLRDKSQFALQLPNISDPSRSLPHMKEMKVQVGGLNAVVGLLEKKRQDPEQINTVIHDVFMVLNACDEEFPSLKDLPFEEIVKSVACYRLRQR